MRRKYTLPVMAAAAAIITPITARATVTVDFSFTGTAATPGTVTGTLLFAQSTGHQGPTDVTITGAPRKFGLTLPYDLGAPGYSTGGFTLSNGNVKHANVTLHFGYVGYLMLSDSATNANRFVTLTKGGGSTANSSGAITFTTVNNSTPAPEPASIALLGAGIAGIAAFRRRRPRA